jgi:peptidoglycan hydrolase-like protein with peptidoglycan-binding domain
MAHPANAPLRAQAVTELQQQRGNFYVQEIIERIRAEKGSGRPLEPQVRAKMESAFGQDFSDVRVHTDAAADRLARELGARAFTSGKDIFFGKGQYSSTSNSGKGLLGHELAHVIQQEGKTGYSAVQDGVSLVGKLGDAFEREAEAAGQAVVSSALATVQPALHVPSVQKQEAEEEAEVPYIELPLVVILSEEQIKSAIKYNKARGYSVETIKIIQRTVGTKDDGIIGTNTVHAIADWQAQKGLVPDGKVGPKTLAKICEEIPKEQAKKLEEVDRINIRFSEGADPSVVSEYTLSVLKDILRKAGEKSATITSTTRTPHKQATVMYDNIKKHGVRSQKRLYGRYGDQVIDVYIEKKKKKQSRDEIIRAMENKIKELGPRNVSKHCGDFKSLQVIDVSQYSIKNRGMFEEAVRKDRRVKKFIPPPTDPAYHLEIPQK